MKLTAVKNIVNNMSRGVLAAALASMVLAGAACGKKEDKAPAGTEQVDTNPTNPTNPTDPTNGGTNPTTGGKPASYAKGQSSVTTNYKGKTKTLSNAAFYLDSGKLTGSLNLSDYDYCDWAASHSPSSYPATPFASLGVILPVDAPSGLLKSGTYSIGSSTPAWAPTTVGYTGDVDQCSFEWPQVPTGSITVDSVENGVITGSVDLTVLGYDNTTTGTIKGNFKSIVCKAVAATPPANDPAACPSTPAVPAAQ